MSEGRVTGLPEVAQAEDRHDPGSKDVVAGIAAQFTSEVGEGRSRIVLVQELLSALDFQPADGLFGARAFDGLSGGVFLRAGAVPGCGLEIALGPAPLPENSCQPEDQRGIKR